jgi:4-hydroxy-tetrahydrodipicolinate reductase
MKPITVVVHGAMGKMGKTVINAVCQEPETRVVGAVDIEVIGDRLQLPDDAGEVPLSSDLESILADEKPDVMVDFTVAKASLPAIRLAAKLKVNMVIGTTGFTAADVEEIKKLAETHDIGIIMASNFTIGAVVMIHLARVAAKYFDAAEIIELHHNMKIDAPSGTALATAKAMVAAKGKPFNRPPVEKGEPQRSRGLLDDGIAIHSIRLPGLMAHQEVIFGAAGQTLTIRHDSIDRECYMPGVMLAVKAVGSRHGLTVGLAPILGLEG